MSDDHPLSKASKHVGSQTRLAQILGVTKAAVGQWKQEGRGVPVKHCAMIERAASGVVTRRDLRPSDWWLIWPEMVDAEHPVPQDREPAHA